MDINKKLLQEINRFRMMSSYQPGRLLSEQDEDNTRKKAFGTDETFPKFSPANKELVEVNMAEDLNELISEKQDDFMKQIPVTLDSNLNLNINGTILKRVDFCQMVKDENYFNGDAVYTRRACNNGTSLYQLKNKKYTVTEYDRNGNLYPKPVTGLATEFKVDNLFDQFIAKYPSYQNFFDTNNDKILENGVSISEYVKNLINSVSLKVVVKPTSSEDLNKFGFTIELSDDKKSRDEYNGAIERLNSGNNGLLTGNFYDVFKTNNFIVPFEGSSRKAYSFLKNNFSEFNFTELVLNIPPDLSQGDIPPVTNTPNPTPTPTPPEVIAFDFVVETAKNYEFDKAELTQQAKDEIDDNITEKFLSILPKYQEGYLKFIKDKEIPVYAYASIDADPYAMDGGFYEGCSQYGVGKGPRKDYNKCLSQARAQKVVDYLKTTQGGIFKDVNFKPVGMGETCQFSGLCWTVKKKGSNEKSPYSTSKTYPDRRFSVNFPSYHADF
jgi:hypothetical protein